MHFLIDKHILYEHLDTTDLFCRQQFDTPSDSILRLTRYV